MSEIVSRGEWEALVRGNLRLGELLRRLEPAPDRPVPDPAEDTAATVRIAAWEQERAWEKARCEAVIAAYSLQLSWTPEGEVTNGIQEYVGTFTAVDPVTRLSRTAVYRGTLDWHENGRPTVLGALCEARMFCVHRDTAPDLFAWLLEHPLGVTDEADDARAQYAQDEELARQMRALLSEDGYREWTRAEDE